MRVVAEVRIVVDTDHIDVSGHSDAFEAAERQHNGRHEVVGGENAAPLGKLGEECPDL